MFELRKLEPLRELSAMQREMDEFVRRIFGGVAPLGLFKRETRGECYPAMDCFTRNGQFILKADLPGIDPKDVDVTITGNILTVRGERKGEEENKEGYIFRETAYGAFERTLTLPEGVDTGKVKATFKNGVLELTMTTKAEALPRKIKVEIEAGKEGRKAA